MPHTSKRIIDVLHDLGWRLSPAELEKLLPDMARITMDDCFWDSAKKFMYHDSLVIFGNRIKSLLNNMTAKRIHREIKCVAANSFSDFDHLLRCPMLKATLNKKVTETINHQWICLSNNSFYDIIFLLSSADLELLLKKYGSLLIVVADNLVDNIFPVTIDGTVK